MKFIVTGLLMFLLVSEAIQGRTLGKHALIKMYLTIDYIIREMGPNREFKCVLDKKVESEPMVKLQNIQFFVYTQLSDQKRKRLHQKLKNINVSRRKAKYMKSCACSILNRYQLRGIKLIFLCYFISTV